MRWRYTEAQAMLHFQHHDCPTLKVPYSQQLYSLPLETYLFSFGLSAHMSVIKWKIFTSHVSVFQINDH